MARIRYRISLHSSDSMIAPVCCTSREIEHEADGLHERRPRARFGIELAPPGTRQLVVLRLAVVVGGAPFGPDPAATFEPMERRVERALRNLESLARNLMDAFGHRPP